MPRQPIQSTKAARRPRSTCAGTHRSSSAMHCCPHGDGSLCASRFASVSWAAVPDIGSTAALLTELASRYANSNLDVVLPCAAAGNRETIHKKKEGASAKKLRSQTISRIGWFEETPSGTQLIDGTLVGAGPSLLCLRISESTQHSPVNLSKDTWQSKFVTAR